MNRVVLGGRLACQPQMTPWSEDPMTMTRLIVPRELANPACEEIVADVLCFAFGSEAIYLAARGRAGDRVSLDGSLAVDTVLHKEGTISRRLCVHIDRITFLDPRSEPAPAPGPRPRAPGVDGSTPRPDGQPPRPRL